MAQPRGDRRQRRRRLADPDAAASVGGIAPGYSNSSLDARPALAPLTDVFATPPPLPFANVFSVGDVLIGIGVAATIVIAMRRGAGTGRGDG